MAVSLIPMPALRAGPQGYNFRPVGQGLDSVRQQNNQNAMLDQRDASMTAQRDQFAQKMAANMMLRKEQMKTQRDQFDQSQSLQRDRLTQGASQFDARMKQSAGQFSQTHGLQKKTFDSNENVRRKTMEHNLVKRFAGAAQLVGNEADPAKRAQMWQHFTSTDPRILSGMPEQLRNDPVAGAQFLIALARGYQDPMQARLNKARINGLEAKAKAALAKANPKKNLASNIVGGLNRLSSVPSEYSRGEFENAVGTSQGDEQGGMLTGITRSAASLWSGIAGGASPTQIRSRIAGDTEALAAAIKPLIRGPGEGVWTDSDQARLVSVVGDLATANTPEDYNQRLRDVRKRVQANFGMQLPEITFPGKKQKKNKKLRKLTPQQAMRLPPGTPFLTTDGRTARVPQRSK